ncbi:hypothetical protein ACVWY3_001614 [Bradyrhizobium sp. USDA 4486]
MSDRATIEALNVLADTLNEAAAKLDSISRSAFTSGLVPGSPVARMVEQGERFAKITPRSGEPTKWQPPYVGHRSKD